MRHLLPAVTIGLGIASASLTWSLAEQPDKSAQPPPAIYRPTISDLMNDVIQPRHTKLWLAGEAENWTLAEYERHTINGAFGRLAAAIPNIKDAQTTTLITTFIAPNLVALATAIKARDQNAFATAYAALTEGCNGCHQATGYSMVVMQSPSGDAFTDQNFQPSAK